LGKKEKERRAREKGKRRGRSINKKIVQRAILNFRRGDPGKNQKEEIGQKRKNGGNDATSSMIGTCHLRFSLMKIGRGTQGGGVQRFFRKKKKCTQSDVLGQLTGKSWEKKKKETSTKKTKTKKTLGTTARKGAPKGRVKKKPSFFGDGQELLKRK